MNQSASLADLGLTEDQIHSCAGRSTLVGDFLSNLHEEIEELQGEVAQLIDQERCRLWIIVASGNEPDGEVDGLTRGASSSIDTEKLMASTQANVVSELKQHAQKVGIVGTVLDAKIFHLPILTTNSIVRAFATPRLQGRMKAQRFSLFPADRGDALRRLKKSGVGTLLAGGNLSVKTRGKKPGTESKTSFFKLANIASDHDRELNACIGEALKAARLIDDFSLEQDFGKGLTPSNRYRMS